MSLEISERVCYVHCNFCNTILAVSVPCGNVSTSVVTVRCGHCANLLSVNIGALLQPSPLYHQPQKQVSSNDDKAMSGGSGSTSFQSVEPQVPRIPAIHSNSSLTVSRHTF
ncbi:hypothetical protein L2E82_35327 [Cichorium intybus]|uniref:Uncharacterized protein n=1 Tax=Cichorium intybus TaxID=13427 RepID=A0ACB9BNL6_CICIN|nr:hypothetical protein L2E82_35327 [Cichorium intybus]